MKISGVNIPAGVTITAPVPEPEPTQLPVEFLRASSIGDTIAEGEFCMGVTGGSGYAPGMMSGFTTNSGFHNTSHVAFRGNWGYKRTPGAVGGTPYRTNTGLVAFFSNVDPARNPTIVNPYTLDKNSDFTLPTVPLPQPITGNELVIIIAGCERGYQAELRIEGDGVEFYYEMGAYNTSGSVAIAGYRPNAGDTDFPGALITKDSYWSMGSTVAFSILLRPAP
jgi:hypothetical protein